MQNSKLQFKIQNLLLALILLLALFLRIYKVAEYPAGLNADEAAIGYNAYSLIQTGKDEFGHSWLITFQSFNDFKPGLYFYLVLPFVKVLGLTELAVRLPSVILGTLSVLILYLLVKQLFGGFSWIREQIFTDTLPLLASFLLAISPWHLHFSRGGWESNAATFFILTGVHFFFLSLRKPINFAFCALSFTLSMYTYHSARIISPLLMLGFVFFYKEKIFTKKNLKYLIVVFGFSALLLVPLAKSFLGKEGTSRFSGVGITADKGPYWRVNELRGQHLNPFILLPKVLHNQYLEYSVQFFDNYLRHFNGGFLFVSGDEIQRNRIPEMGQMYLIEFPFLILGLYFLLKNRQGNWKFLLWWLLMAPVASALTFQSPHAIRSLNMVIPLVILVAYGIYSSFEYLKNQSKTVVFTACCLLFAAYTWNISFYLHQYYVHYPQIYPASWEYGFSELADYLEQKQDQFDKVFVTDKYDQPYILLAFYLKYPPADFQNEAKLTPKDQYGFSTVDHFSKYYFGHIDFINDEKYRRGRILVVGSPEEIPDSATITKRIYFKDGKTEAFRIVEN